MALFGQSGGGRREPKSAVEFRAGKMTLNGTTVTADPRKGLAFMQVEDGLLHYYWKDRKTGKVEDDLIIFPGDAEFKRVSQCTTGRVFLLKFTDSSSRKFFYWMQEPNEEKDEEFQKKVNDIIEHPPDPSQEGRGGTAGPPGFLGVPSSQLQALLGASGGRGIDQQQLMELVNSGALPLGSMGGMLTPFHRGTGGGSGAVQSASGTRPSSSSTTTTSPPAATPQQPPRQEQQPQAPSKQAQRPVQLEDLQNILSTMNVPANSSQEGGEGSPEDHVGLAEVVTPDVLRPLASSEEVQGQLADHLPPTSESAESVLTSPQFRQAVGVFGSALQSGELGSLMTQFGLGEDVALAAGSGDIHGFAEALQNELGEKSDQSEEAKPEKDEGDSPTGKEPDAGST